MPNFSLDDSVFAAAAEQFPTPFYLYDERGIRETARQVNRAFAWADDFREYFAVKALPNPMILEVLLDEGCGLDCASMAELIMAERLGVGGDRLMFSANAMPPEEYGKAGALGAIINLDDISDIDTLIDQVGVPEVVCARYNPGGAFVASNDIIGKPGDSKFGWTRPQLTEGLIRLKRLGVQRFGLHAFLASNNTGSDYYPALAEVLMTTALEVSAEAGLPLSFVNLSGGIGIPYRPGEPAADIMAIGDRVRQVYARLLGSGAGVGVKAELGRYMTGPHGWLVTRAMHEKDIHKRYIGVDASAGNLLRPAMYGAYHHISVVGKRDAPEDMVYDVTGALCENNDKFAIDRKLPRIDMGDLLLIHDAGAHAFAMGYQYNGRLRSAEVLYRLDGSFQLIRRAETVEDYFATMVWS